MSATNKTTHYELPSFIASDKPAWLVDWNGAMSTIDAAIYEAKSTADTAGTNVSTLSSDLSTLSSTVTTQGTSITTLSDSLTTLTGVVNTITSLIGNGEPTTTDKTIIGAINEINAQLTNEDASDVSYDNTTSELVATNVQAAIDEVVGSLDTLSDSAALKAAFTPTAIAITTAMSNYGTVLVDCTQIGRELIVDIHGAITTAAVPAGTPFNTTPIPTLRALDNFNVASGIANDGKSFRCALSSGGIITNTVQIPLGSRVDGQFVVPSSAWI